MREVELHIESHLVASRSCPVCGEVYDKGNQTEFEQHVQEHFLSEEYSLPTAEDAASAQEEGRLQQQQQEPAQAQEQQQQAQQQQQQAGGNLPFGIDLGQITNSIRTWTLDID